jgi:5-hydroxyisourate hydrolase-like protein (transthyretin family)
MTVAAPGTYRCTFDTQAYFTQKVRRGLPTATQIALTLNACIVPIDPWFLGYSTEQLVTHSTSQGGQCFYPTVPIIFVIQNPSEHYHIPLLLSPFGYSTYRGS